MEALERITKMYSYLITPGKGNDAATPVAGTEIPLKGRMFAMLKEIFDNAEDQCKIPIKFSMNGDGDQKNPVRDEIVSFLKAPSEPNGLVIAKRLQDVTTGRSALGLLFFTVGTNGLGESKLVISRFPADQGVLAEHGSSGLTVQFVEKVFMKSAHAYKSALYVGTSHDGDFWDGHAVDRQINSAGSLADYWIRDFLQSDFKITAKEGTKQLALALKEASVKLTKDTDRAEIVAAIQLVKNLDGQATSIYDFATRFGLSKTVKETLVSNLPHAELAGLTFKFDGEEFARHAGYISKELDTGAILTAPAENFDKVFSSKAVPSKEGEIEFTTAGKVISQRVKNRKN